MRSVQGALPSAHITLTRRTFRQRRTNARFFFFYCEAGLHRSAQAYGCFAS
ncbi:hypothetical protein JG687_00016455 [Phytophthora cactorum]|uniref:Uncharacterized protein n=1 Tax=Phytophthora cactorum TaxID=29920 RepID=A0A8T1TT80_9STRA|nr:hypothetical protein JG687_00016455 [Phytophthora cactorum]